MLLTDLLFGEQESASRQERRQYERIEVDRDLVCTLPLI
jgi:hypothetical protein